MNSEEIVAVNKRPVCEPVTFFVRKLLSRGFTMINNGGYKVDYQRPTNDSLSFRLQSPVKLETLDLSADAYYMAHLGSDDYMCECHYHMVKLISGV